MSGGWDGDWVHVWHDLPSRSGLYLCYDIRDRHIWVGIWCDGDDKDGPYSNSKIGWVADLYCTHWRKLPPEPPHGNN